MPSDVTLQVQQSLGQLNRLAGIDLAGVGLGTHAMPAPHWVAWQRSVSHFGSAGCRTDRSAQGTFQHGSGWQLPATQRSPSPHLPGTQRSLQVPSSQYLPVVAGDAEARVVLAAAADADLRRRCTPARIVAVDAAAVQDAGLRGIEAGHARAQVDALAGVLVAALARRAGDALAALRDAELVHALVSGRAGHLAARALQDALAVAAAEARRALRGGVDHAVAVVVLAVADLGASAARSPRRRSPSCRGRRGGRPCRCCRARRSAPASAPGQRQV